MECKKCCICKRCINEVAGHFFKNKHNGKYMCEECARGNGVLEYARKNGAIKNLS